MLKILEVQQGVHPKLEGVKLEHALQELQSAETAFLEKFPSTRQYHRRSWAEREVEDKQTAPWGYVWYAADERGVLRVHSAHYDSSG